MKLKEKIKKLKKTQNGITLIALVVTIVVLLILAAISINLILGDNGIFSKANDAKNRWAEAEASEREGLNALNNKINEILNNKGNAGKIPEEVTKVSDLLGETEGATENRIAQDEYGNKIVIPAGFTVVAHGGTTDVTYGYSGDTNKPAVQDGIVIQDVDGNQFVWVPVGNIKNKDKSTKTINLGRYTFDENGNATVVQTANSTSAISPMQLNGYFYEVSKDYEGSLGSSITNAKTKTNNTKAYNLQEWIDTTLENGGYYIARYEASKNGEKAASKKSIRAEYETTSSLTVPKTPITDGMLWNFITQPRAATAAQKMYPYSDTSKVYSDLVNSYAWDTAIVFIQECSGDRDYSIQKSINTSLANTGDTGDKVCNIYDMASNAEEWTTEIAPNSSYSCVARGGCFMNQSNYYAGYRNVFSNSTSYNDSSFRTVLCVK